MRQPDTFATAPRTNTPLVESSRMARPRQGCLPGAACRAPTAKLQSAPAVPRLWSFLWPPRTSVVCDRLSGSGGRVLAKIAVELEQALARRAATGALACHPGGHVLARGGGWVVGA